jgi:hypothetical protein
MDYIVLKLDRDDFVIRNARDDYLGYTTVWIASVYRFGLSLGLLIERLKWLGEMSGDKSIFNPYFIVLYDHIQAINEQP